MANTSQNILEKIPPHNIEAEEAVIGSLLIDHEGIIKIADKLKPEDFYKEANNKIYEIILGLFSKHEPIDILSLSNKLEEKSLLDKVGGRSYLVNLANKVPSATNIENYANIVQKKATLRRLINVAGSILELGYDEDKNVEELLDRAEQGLFSVSQQHLKQNFVHVKNVLSGAFDRIDEIHQDGDALRGLTSGFIDIDNLLGGFQKSDLVILAARPSMGKTTFAMNLAENAAMTSDKPALIFSLEMPSEQIMMRMLASLGRIDQTKIRTGQLEDEDWARLSSTMGLLIEKGKMYIDDAAGLTPTEVRSRARRVARDNGGISLIMVDYLQLMRAPQFADNRTLEIAEISRSLKALAKELEVPVIALSQLNRSLEQRADKRPVNSDLRESGSIEQDADLIMFIYRDEVYHDDSEFKGMAEIIIGKQRNGPIGRVPLTFQGQFSRFDNYAGPHVLEED